MDRFETIVVGLGAMGSAALYQLAKRGNKVLGLDRFSPPHDYGSSHGESRIVRQAIGEGEQYVPFALRSYELWREIENETGLELLTITGGLTLESQSHSALMHGQRDFIDRAIRCAQKFQIAHEVLANADIRRRFPQFAVTGERGYYEPKTGFVRPERCIEAQLCLARRHGAAMHTGETVVGFESRASEVHVITSQGRYAAENVILAAGSWISRFLPPTHAPLFQVYRQVMYWFEIDEPHRSLYAPAAFPIFIWIFGAGSEFGFYGFPSFDGRTIKVATEKFAEPSDPDHVQRFAGQEETGSFYEQYLRARLPGISRHCKTAASCLYTTTPDSQFVIEVHPEDQRIIIASPCSGHGFKHSAAIGEALAQEVIDGESRIDLSSFSLRRFDPRV